MVCPAAARIRHCSVCMGVVGGWFGCILMWCGCILDVNLRGGGRRGWWVGAGAELGAFGKEN